ncbi:DMT family transporter [Defluviicoccus vanus]
MSIAWLALAATIVCSSGGNVITNWSHRFSGLRHLLVLGIASGIQVVGLLFYSMALTAIPLSIAYSILVGSTLVVVTIVAALWFKERLTRWHLIGIALIILGMALIKSGKQHDHT